MCSGNGWYLTKHAATLFGSEPGTVPLRASSEALPKAVGAAPLTVVRECSGAGRVEAYTVLYDREGAPVRGIAVGRLEGGGRFVANTPDDRGLLESIAARELCGVDGRVECRDGLGRFMPA